jgi:GntR family transcriptional regulator
MEAPRQPPRYSVIAEWLRAQCEGLPPGSLLPSEAELAARFEVSRMTARHAVQQLERSGHVERRRGAGSFVAPRPLHRSVGTLVSFTEDMARRGMRSSSAVLEAEVGVDAHHAALLGLDPGAWLVKLVRVRYADDRSLALERVFLPGQFADVLEADLETGSLHAALRARGRQISNGHAQVAARMATEEELKVLGLAPPAALLVESRLIYDTSGRAVESTETAYIASRWVIDNGWFTAGKASAQETAAPMAPAQVPSTPTTTS